MALKISLKPNERMIIDGAVITNGGRKTEFIVENKVPILRQNNIMSEKAADTPCKRLYLTAQLIYIDNTQRDAHHALFNHQAAEIIEAAPSIKPYIAKMSDELLEAHYYRALKTGRDLINYEAEVLSRV
ncbi:MAG: flagellar biosynthesis repressor FlbT [Desulfosarcinaceae bacterium]|nr:flagellar biosynthesis repressor FlbT [Desulfosarcinaceae bacterium]